MKNFLSMGISLDDTGEYPYMRKDTVLGGDRQAKHCFCGFARPGIPPGPCIRPPRLADIVGQMKLEVVARLVLLFKTDRTNQTPSKLTKEGIGVIGFSQSEGSLVDPCTYAGSKLKGVVLLALCIALTSCQSRKSDTGPSIEFSKIPPAAQGGRERVDTIAGRVRNARSGQQIVIYAHSGPWWVQPWPDRPFIPIKADSTWSTETHLGFEYAALLVEPDYHPPPTLDVAPTPVGGVALVKIVKGTGTPQFAPTKPLKFSGYDWGVRMIASDKGGTNNLYDPDNAWTDASGALHLQIKKKSGRWSCAEIFSNRSLGYGTYAVTVRDVSHLEPAAVFNMFTFEEWVPDQHYREMDVEISRWGDVTRKNDAQYVIQPFYIPGNLFAFDVPSGRLTLVMRWESGRASFKTYHGSSTGPGARLVSEHEFTTGIPSPGQAKLRLILYVVASDKSPLQKDSEVVIEKFEYLP